VFIGPQGQAVLFRYLARSADEHCFRPCDSDSKRRAILAVVRVTPLSCGNRAGTNRRRRPQKSPGSWYTTDSYRRAIHYACDKAFPHPEFGSVIRDDMPVKDGAALKQLQSDHRWSSNQLLHAAATEVRKQFGLEAAQIVLGHSSADVTQVYAERDMAKGLEVARRIG
jgi:hypothetical protein